MNALALLQPQAGSSQRPSLLAASLLSSPGFSASPALHPGWLAGLQGAALIMIVLLCQMDYKWNHLWSAHKVIDKG